MLIMTGSDVEHTAVQVLGGASQECLTLKKQVFAFDFDRTLMTISLFIDSYNLNNLKIYHDQKKLYILYYTQDSPSSVSKIITSEKAISLVRSKSELSRSKQA